MNPLTRSFIAVTAILFAAGLIAEQAASAPIGSSFTYQGQIQKGGSPYTGTAQLLFRLFDSLSNGTQVGPDDPVANVSVTNGLFTVELDFGANAFQGDGRWLEIQLKTTGDNNYTLLNPRQKITAEPYSLFSTAGAGGGGYWLYNNGYLSYSGGNVAVLGGSGQTPNSGKGVFLEGGSTDGGYIWAHNYDTNHPLSLFINPFGSKVSVGSFNTLGEFTSVSNTDAAIVGKHTSNWVGVYGESQSSVGVWGKSFTGIGVQGETGAAYNGGVIGYCSNVNGWGGYFKNTAGGTSLYVDGKAVVGSLDILGGSDIVEGFETGARTLEPGTVVVIDEDRPGSLCASSVRYDHRVAGVVSGAGGIAPGLRLGQKGVLDGATPVAMNGRVYVRCSAENGPIRPGDLLTTASAPGRAMRATHEARSHGAVLGKAMTSLERGSGLVLALVNLQ